MMWCRCARLATKWHQYVSLYIATTNPCKPQILIPMTVYFPQGRRHSHSTSRPRPLATTSRATHTEERGMSHNNERLDVQTGRHVCSIIQDALAKGPAMEEWAGGVQASGDRLVQELRGWHPVHESWHEPDREHTGALKKGQGVLLFFFLMPGLNSVKAVRPMVRGHLAQLIRTT